MPSEGRDAIQYIGRRKDGSLESYYRAHGLEEEEIAQFVGHAVSEDGIRKEKAVLNLVGASGSAGNNLV